jgi:hypothetical protein
MCGSFDQAARLKGGLNQLRKHLIVSRHNCTKRKRSKELLLWKNMDLAHFYKNCLSTLESDFLF